MKKSRVFPLIMGGLLGAILGIIAAFLFLHESERSETAPRISPGQGFKAGMGVITLLRTFADLGKGKK
jgi:hypothetical protein